MSTKRKVNFLFGNGNDTEGEPCYVADGSTTKLQSWSNIGSKFNNRTPTDLGVFTF